MSFLGEFNGYQGLLNQTQATLSALDVDVASVGTLDVSGDTTIKGNLTVEGKLTTIETENLIVRDNLIKVADGNDTSIFGLYGQYASNDVKDLDPRYGGMIYSPGESTFHFFSDNMSEPVDVASIPHKANILCGGLDTDILDVRASIGSFPLTEPISLNLGTLRITPLGITTELIKQYAVANDKILDGAISTIKLADQCVSDAKILAGTITATSLADNCVITAKILDGAVGTSKIETKAITAAKMSVNSVGTSSLVDNGITTEKIAASAITVAKMANLSVGTAQLVDASVATDKIAASAITVAKMANLSVGTSQIIDGSITTDKIANGSVMIGKMSILSVNTPQLVDGCVKTDKIDTKTITQLKLADASVGTAQLIASNITTDKIAGGAITNTLMAVGSVATANIIASNITTDKIASAAITNTLMATDSVATANIIASNITTDKIASAAITNALMAAGSVATAQVIDGNITRAKLEDGIISDIKVSDVAASKITEGTFGGGNYTFPANLHIIGDLSVAGASYTIASTDYNVSASIIEAGFDNVADTLNEGISWKYRELGADYYNDLWGGLIRRAGTNDVYLLGESNQPTSTVDITGGLFPRANLLMGNLTCGTITSGLINSINLTTFKSSFDTLNARIDQNLLTTSSPSFSGLTLTGNLVCGANLIDGIDLTAWKTAYDILSGRVNQNVLTTSSPSFVGMTLTGNLTLSTAGATVDGIDLTAWKTAYDTLSGRIDQNVLTTSSPSFVGMTLTGNLALSTAGATVDGIDLTAWKTAYDTLSGRVNQNVLTTSSPTFVGMTLTGNLTLSTAGATVDGIDISGTLDQAVKTTSSPSFAGLTVNGTTTISGNIVMSTLNATVDGVDLTVLSGKIDQSVKAADAVTFSGLTISTGNITLTQAGATVDGVDLSLFKSDYDSKVNQAVKTTSSPTFNSITITSGSLSLSGGVSSTTATHSGIVTITDTTDSSSTITGALVVAGGVGIGKKVFVGDTLTLSTGKTLAIAGVDMVKYVHDGTTSFFNVFLGGAGSASAVISSFNTCVGYSAGAALSYASFNTLVGYGAGNKATSAFASNTYSTCVGYNAGAFITTAFQNTVLGGSAGLAITTSDRNTVVGASAFQSGTGAHNTMLGYNSGSLGVAGDWNTCIGSGSTFTSGVSTAVALGYNVGATVPNGFFVSSSTAALTSGSPLLFNAGQIGPITGAWTIANATTFSNNLTLAAGKKLVIGTLDALKQTSSSVFVGNAGNDTLNQTLAICNVCVGHSAGAALTEGHRNTLIGNNAGSHIAGADGMHNTLVGYAAGDSITTSFYNTVVGSGAYGLGVGDYNTIIGANAASTATTGNLNVCIGPGSTFSAGVLQSTAIGYGAHATLTDGFFINPNTVALTSGSPMLFNAGQIGPITGAWTIANATTFSNDLTIAAGKKLKIGNNDVLQYSSSLDNVFVGPSALSSTLGNANVCVGRDAGMSLAYAGYNTLIGYNAGKNIIWSAVPTAGENRLQNTCIGFMSGSSITTGSKNTIIGGQTAGSITTGTYNTVIGVAAFISGTGSHNTMIGGYSGTTVSITGDNNTCIGKEAAFTDGKSNTIALGCQATASVSYGFFVPSTTAALTDGTVLLFKSGQIGPATSKLALTSDGTLQLNGLSALRMATSTRIFIGNAGNTTMTSNNNLCIGDAAGASLTANGANVYIGGNCGTLSSTTVDTYNTVVGYNSGIRMTTCSLNAFFGSFAGIYVATGSSNTGCGTSAFRFGVGSGNTCLGDVAGPLTGNTAGNYNTVLGATAKYNDTIDYSVALGYGATASVPKGFFVRSDTALLTSGSPLLFSSGQIGPITGAWTIANATTFSSASGLSVAGNITMTTAAATIDGVDISVFKTAYDANINQALLTTSSPTFNNLTLNGNLNMGSMGATVDGVDIGLFKGNYDTFKSATEASLATKATTGSAASFSSLTTGPIAAASDGAVYIHTDSMLRVPNTSEGGGYTTSAIATAGGIYASKKIISTDGFFTTGVITMGSGTYDADLSRYQTHTTTYQFCDTASGSSNINVNVVLTFARIGKIITMSWAQLYHAGGSLTYTARYTETRTVIPAEFRPTNATYFEPQGTSGTNFGVVKGYVASNGYVGFYKADASSMGYGGTLQPFDPAYDLFIKAGSYAYTT